MILRNKNTIKNGLLIVLIAFGSFTLLSVETGCSFSLKLNDASIPDSIKTLKVNYIENRAQYVNPQLSPRLSDKLRQKFTNQTKLKLINGDNADWEISGEIREYSLSTSAISGQQAANNRITVGMHIIIDKKISEKTEEYDISRGFEFKGNQSLQQAETALLDEMIRTLTDEIFNKLFSKW